MTWQPGSPISTECLSGPGSHFGGNWEQGVVREVSMESLILAQDERWRRA